MPVIPFRIGEVLIAVEDVHYWSWAESSRWPRQLIVEARIIWISSLSIKVRLPEVQIICNDNTIHLPPTHFHLSKFAMVTRVSSQHSDTDEPCEWKYQPFYPKVYGNAWTAEFATFYSQSLWESYRQFFASGISKPCKVVSEPSARVLGVPPDATSREVSAAFRAKVKQVHPDYGGSGDAFQRLLEARDKMYAKSAAYQNVKRKNKAARYSS